MVSDEERMVVLEERVAWLQHLTEELSAQMAAQDRRVLDLEARLERTSFVLRSLAQERSSDLLGANPEDDPVPRSG